MIVDEIALLPKKVRENLNFTSFTRNYSVPIHLGHFGEFVPCFFGNFASLERWFWEKTSAWSTMVTKIQQK